MNNKKDEGQNGNYGIESNTILLKNILEESVYVIPAYQRPYEWKYSQIDKVLEEIFSLADNEASKEEYAFLGSLQFNINENEEKGAYPVLFDYKKRSPLTNDAKAVFVQL